MALSKKQLKFIEGICKNNNLRVEFAYSRPRKTKLGDHTWDESTQTSQITVNIEDNSDRVFFVTLHELAHAHVTQTVFRTHHRSPHLLGIKPHGIEWKKSFGDLLTIALNQKLFPEELNTAISKHARAPKANYHSDPQLIEALESLSKNTNSVETLRLKDLQDGDQFRIKGSRTRFTRKKLRRSRYLCLDDNGRQFAISSMAEVETE